MSDTEEFEEQFRQEAAEKQRQCDLKAGKIKTDPDGTVYDWDEEKKAWFPRVDDDFLAKYQMSYGVASEQQKSDEATTASAAEKIDKNVPPAPSVSDPGYPEWYYKYYCKGESSSSHIDTTTQEYKDWYNYYYGNVEATSDDSNKDNGSDVDNKEHKEQSELDREYYAYYYQHYGEHNEEEMDEESDEANKPKLDPNSEEYWLQLKSQKSDDTSKDKDTKKTEDNKTEKGKKRKLPPPPPEPPKWFEIDETKNTNVYVTGLSDLMTDDGFVELMNKYGLIMFDPHTKKPKTKLYKDKDGNNKGDGRCCYIKSECVDLALQLLDGSNIDGHKITVERAKFQLKGRYDPSKKKKKLTNSQKRKLKERQEKLFDWRPDKPLGTRGRHERVVIVKNLFDPKEFDKNPALINEIRQDLRDECQTYGDATKVMLFDRHPDGAASINFKQAEEADACIEALHGRFFAGRQLVAETWDGKSKYEIEETEEQKAERLKKWEAFLEEDDSKQSKSSELKPNKTGEPTANKGDESTANKECEVIPQGGGAEASAAPIEDAGSASS